MSHLDSITPSLIQRGHIAALVCALWVCQGCASNVMMARDLPREWNAVAASNAQTIDLSKLASSTIPQDLISRGDVISVDMALGRTRADDVSVKSQVQDNGQIDLALVGSIPVVGLNMVEAADAIKTAAISRGFYQNPQVTVQMSRAKTNLITVIGAVKEPKIYELRPGNSDLLQAITAAGGLSDEAGTIVELRHAGFKPNQSSGGGRAPAIADGGPDGVISAGVESEEVSSGSPQTLKVDLASIGSEGVSIPTLSDGMVVFVSRLDPPRLSVDGLVKAPGQFEYPVGENLTILDAVTLAKGMSNPLADKIYIIRKRPGTPEPGLIQVSYRKAKRSGQENLLLQPGDKVVVEQTPATIVLDTLQYAKINLSGRVF